METESNNQQLVQDLNVAADETSIYQGGNLTRVDIDELLDNPIAIRQLVNDLNLSKRENESLRDRIEDLNLERASYVMQPFILSFVAFVNIVGVALVGLGTNYITLSYSQKRDHAKVEFPSFWTAG